MTRTRNAGRRWRPFSLLLWPLIACSSCGVETPLRQDAATQPPSTVAPSASTPTCDAVCEHVIGCARTGGDASRERTKKEALSECKYSCPRKGLSKAAMQCWVDTPCSDINGIVFPKADTCPAMLGVEGG